MKLYFETFGEEDRPTILMLHGSGAPPQSLHALALILADQYRVILPHRNGYGRTGVHAYDPQAELAALLDLVGESAIILGHSFGAFRAFQLAALAPDRISQVVGMGSIAGLNEDAREGVEGLVEFLRRTPDVTDAMAANWLTPEYLANNPGVIEMLQGWFDGVDRETAILENLELLDQGRTLAAFVASGVPARMYVGELDLATPPALTQLIAAHAPNATMTVVGEIGHLPMIEDIAGSVTWIRETLGS